ncbi:MAG TPA: MFS transporter, partial [Rhizomicrobium sp.]|nr:MFS transporter [Rhizomicrobium sp.]
MLVVLLIAYTLSFLDRTLLSLLIAPVKQDLGLSDTGISLLLGFAFALLYTVVGVPLGYLADRTNRRRLIITGIVFWSTMTALCGLAKNFWSLFAARIGVGIGEATLTPAAYSILSDSFPRKRLGRVMAIYSVGLPLGSGLALGLGGVLIDWITSLGPVALPFLGVLAPWRLSFIFVGVSGLAVVLLMLSVREPKRRKNITTANNDTTNNGTQTSG